MARFSLEKSLAYIDQITQIAPGKFATPLGRPVHRKGQSDLPIPLRQRSQERGNVQSERDRVGDARGRTDEGIQVDAALDRHVALAASGIVQDAFGL
jgi:hypothetical protein